MHLTCSLGEKSWGVTFTTLNISADTHEMVVSGDGLRFHLIIGNHAYGSYLCIPSLGIGCELAALTDTFWNRESIGQYLSPFDTETIVCVLKHSFPS